MIQPLFLMHSGVLGDALGATHAASDHAGGGARPRRVARGSGVPFPGYAAEPPGWKYQGRSGTGGTRSGPEYCCLWVHVICSLLGYHVLSVMSQWLYITACYLGGYGLENKANEPDLLCDFHYRLPTLRTGCSG